MGPDGNDRYMSFAYQHDKRILWVLGKLFEVKYKKLLQSGPGYTIIGIKPGR